MHLALCTPVKCGGSGVEVVCDVDHVGGRARPPNKRYGRGGGGACG